MVTIHSPISSLDALLRARLEASLAELEPPAVAQFSDNADLEDVQAVLTVAQAVAERRN